MSSAPFMKRLEVLKQRISFRRPRQIFVWVDGDKEDQPEADAILQELDVKPNDLVIYLRRFDGNDPDMPRLCSITTL